MTFQTGIFTATNNVDETYDAYERDIAIVSFYFKLPTAFEYTRYTSEALICYTVWWILPYRELRMTPIGFISQVRSSKIKVCHIVYLRRHLLNWLDWWPLGTVHWLQLLVRHRVDLLVHLPTEKKCHLMALNIIKNVRWFMAQILGDWQAKNLYVSLGKNIA